MNILTPEIGETMLRSTIVETPAELRAMHPLQEAAKLAIVQTRLEIADILAGSDHRMLAIVGPCSEDDKVLPDGTLGMVRIAEELKELQNDSFVSEHIKVVMRMPPAKPRTDEGPAGLEQKDLVKAHAIMTEVANMGLPVAIEIMHDRHFARYGDMLSLDWIGARDVGATLLRHAVSAHEDIPTLFKNGTDGHFDIALKAMKTAGLPHAVDILDEHNRLIHIAQTHGNSRTGLFHRGGDSIKIPVDFENSLLDALDTEKPVVVDCAHGNEAAHDLNGEKSVKGQIECINHVLRLVALPEFRDLRGIAIEAHVFAGKNEAKPGMSNTDPCIDIQTAKELVIELAKQKSM